MPDHRRQFLKTVSAAVIGAGSNLAAIPRRLEFPAPQGIFAVTNIGTASFTLKWTMHFRKVEGEQTVLDIPQILNVRLRQHDPRDRTRQNYPAFKMPDGSVPVLEATLLLHSPEHPEWTQMTIGVPLAMLKKPVGKHEIVLHFSGARWSIYGDGELLDNDFPFGYPKWEGEHTWTLDPEHVQNAVLDFFTHPPEPNPVPPPIPSSRIQYWLPPGHNSWVGDVVTLFHAARYHVFYLYDRRHHQSKFGKGAHYFEHLSTLDFKTWTQHPAATPIEEQWECIGTGTPFVFESKVFLSYGLHTGRIYPEEKTTWPAQWDYLKNNGRTGSFKRATTLGIPAGATYSVSSDGIAHFKKSNIMFHPCQNPSVYVDPSGKLRLLANAGSKGIWESESVDGGWQCVSPAFPPGGDCTFFFRWGQFDYIIGGFTGLWSKAISAPDGAYEDIVAKGLDFYDGSNVPSITEITGGRFLMAAWIPIRGWGGTLLIRELLQFADGRIGSKWLEEITPPSEKAQSLAPLLNSTAKFPVVAESFMLLFDVEPLEAQKGRLAISFLPANGEQNSCELQIQFSGQRAQFASASANSFAAWQKSLREGNSPQAAADYAIENLIGIDRTFTLRVLVKCSGKLGGSLVDAEIAGQRTMISYRPELAVKHLLFRTEGIAVRNIQIAPLKEEA